MGLNKPWKILLLDRYKSHYYKPFQLKAAENHIKLFYFPSHLTHILQPLDVSIFRPWKHYYKLAIQAALWSLDFDYTITSFFWDLTSIRQQTMRKHTIVNAFTTSRMYPPSAKAGIKKMRSYRRKKRSIDEVEAENNTLELPKLLPTRPSDIWNTAATVRALDNWDSIKYSDGTVQTFHKTMKDVDLQLQKSQLLSVQHQALQDKLRADYNKKAKSRKSSHKGGASAPVSQLQTEIKAREEADQVKALRKAERKLTTTINKARNELIAKGVQAQKDERARKERLQEIAARGDFPDIALLVPIREPDKNPTVIEQTCLLEDFYPELVQQINELKAQQELPSQLVLQADDDNNVIINTTAITYEKDIVEDLLDSSPPPPEYIDSSDAESIDSICRNADLVRF